MKKAAKDVVELKDDMEVDGPSLKEVVGSWKAAQGSKAESSQYVLIPVYRSALTSPKRQQLRRLGL